MDAGSDRRYASALDLGSDEGSGGVSDIPEDTTAPGDRENLPEEVVIALADGCRTVAAVQEHVNARPGSYVAQGPIEAQLVALEAANKVRRKGSEWELTAEGHAGHDVPASIVKRRAEIVSTMLVMVFPADNSFNDLPGVAVSELCRYLLNADDDSGSYGALSAEGWGIRDLPADLITRDLDALVAGGLLVKREPQDEADLRHVTAVELEGDEAGEAAPEHYYAFAVGVVPRLMHEGAAALVTPTVPGAPPHVLVGEAVREAEEKHVAFARASGERLEAERAQRLTAEGQVAKIRSHLDGRNLAFLVDEALGPPSPPAAPARKTFLFAQTAAMDDHQRAMLLDEIADLERKIAEENARMEGAKMSAAAVKTTGKERLAGYEDAKRSLLAQRDAKERTIEVEAYSLLLKDGDAASDGKPVNMIHAVGGNGVRPDLLLKREVLSASAAVAAFQVAAGVEPVKKEPAAAKVEAPAPPVDEADVAAKKVADEQAARAAELGAGTKIKVELTPAGLTPHVLAAVISGAGGAATEDAVVAAVATATGLAAPALGSIVKITIAKLHTRDKAIERTDAGAFVYPTDKTILALVNEAGDTGLRRVDLHERFAVRTGVQLTPAIEAALVDRVGAMVAAEDLAMGPLPGARGDLLWLAGSTDPRRVETAPAGSAKAAAAGTAPTPKSDGAKSGKTGGKPKKR